MDLQAAYMKQGKRDTLAKLTVALCFAVAGALLIGSLISPGKAHTKLLSGAALSMGSKTAAF